MSTSTKKLIFLLMVPLSAGEGCGQGIKPFKSKFEKKKTPAVGATKKPTDPKQKSFLKSSSANVSSKKNNSAITNKHLAIPNEHSAKIVGDAGVATSSQPPATATQKQTDQIASDPIIDRVSEQEEQAKDDGYIGGEDRDQDQHEAPTKPLKAVEKSLINRLKSLFTKKPRKADRASSEA